MFKGWTGLQTSAIHQIKSCNLHLEWLKTMALKITIVVLCLALLIAYQLVDRFDPETVKGRNIIITGASTGIGEQLAYHYARLGANIVITARREQQLQQVIEKCREVGNRNGRYYYVALDMMDQQSPSKLVHRAEKYLGGVDYLVLNHITSHYLGEWLGSAENSTRLERMFSVNFHSYVNIASRAMRLLEESKGSIIVMSSICGKCPMPFIAPYVATKHHD